MQAARRAAQSYSGFIGCCLTTLLLLTAGCGPRLSRETSGPMVGHTTTRSSRIWVRTGSLRPVVVRYGSNPKMLNRTTRVIPTKQSDYTAVLKLEGLKPSTRYFYRVETDGTLIGEPNLSFRTAPTGPAVVRIAFGSCARFRTQTAFDAVRRADPHLLLLLGDNIYSDTTDQRLIHRHYRWTREQPEYGALIGRTPTLGVWDDHDYVANNTDGHAPGKELVLAAFKRYWANPTYGTDGVPGVWHKTRFGDVEVFMLDVRYHRGLTPGSMLGPTQLRWLLRGLKASTATYKILASGSIWVPAGRGDSWASFPDERRRIFDFIMKNKIFGVLLLSGDIHRPMVLRHTKRGPASYELYEFVSSPLANRPSRCRRRYPGVKELFCAQTYRNFGLLRFDTRASPPKVRYEVRDARNRVRFRLDIPFKALSF